MYNNTPKDKSPRFKQKTTKQKDQDPPSHTQKTANGTNKENRETKPQSNYKGNKEYQNQHKQHDQQAHHNNGNHSNNNNKQNKYNKQHTQEDKHTPQNVQQSTQQQNNINDVFDIRDAEQYLSQLWMNSIEQSKDARIPEYKRPSVYQDTAKAWGADSKISLLTNFDFLKELKSAYTAKYGNFSRAFPVAAEKTEKSETAKNVDNASKSGENNPSVVQSNNSISNQNNIQSINNTVESNIITTNIDNHGQENDKIDTSNNKNNNPNNNNKRNKNKNSKSRSKTKNEEITNNSNKCNNTDDNDVHTCNNTLNNTNSEQNDSNTKPQQENNNNNNEKKEEENQTYTYDLSNEDYEEILDDSLEVKLDGKVGETDQIVDNNDVVIDINIPDEEIDSPPQNQPTHEKSNKKQKNKTKKAKTSKKVTSPTMGHNGNNNTDKENWSELLDQLLQKSNSEQHISSGSGSLRYSASGKLDFVQESSLHSLTITPPTLDTFPPELVSVFSHRYGKTNADASKGSPDFSGILPIKWSNGDAVVAAAKKFPVEVPLFLKDFVAPNVKRSKFSCANLRCENTTPEDKPFKTCAKCNNAAYCSKECQKEDWVKRHKMYCKDNANEEQRKSNATQKYWLTAPVRNVVYMHWFSRWGKGITVMMCKDYLASCYEDDPNSKEVYMFYMPLADVLSEDCPIPALKKCQSEFAKSLSSHDADTQVVAAAAVDSTGFAMPFIEEMKMIQLKLFKRACKEQDIQKVDVIASDIHNHAILYTFH